MLIKLSPPDPLFGEASPSWWMLLDFIAKLPVVFYYQEVTIQSSASVIATMEMAKNPTPSLSLYRSLLVTVAYGGRCGLEEADCKRWLDSALTLTLWGLFFTLLLCFALHMMKSKSSRAPGTFFYHFPLRETLFHQSFPSLSLQNPQCFQNALAIDWNLHCY